ncbi:hypothetical protein K490DRAFT_55995 [Saccharata proteae CBS 121410]|uniref:Uncharacterized protein n=1 Tax=Saccharata proteae CBS 121410 TaxID=1314787 RepID=A0A9P4HZW5_9PEZI|nr:hypothetical protein K490DRAFT_55995 [Saccharata proteae CBS 121410]
MSLRHNINNVLETLGLPHHANKTRIHLVPYSIDGAPPPSFHWALWLESPHDTPFGAAFDVKIPHQYSNIGPQPPWVYDLNHPGSYQKSPRMLGRILIGKVPKGVGIEGVERVLRTVALPVGDEACKDWLITSILRLQENGIIEEFDVKRLFEEATEWGTVWWKELRERRKAGKEKKHPTINYLGNRRFP